MSLSPDYAPVNETASDLWLERSNLAGLTVLSSTAYGVFLCLYILCVSVLIKPIKIFGGRAGPHQRYYIIHLVYTTAMFILITLANGANARIAQATWIDNRNYPGGPNAFTVDVPNLRANVLGYVTFIMASWLQDGYVLYRFLVFSDWTYWLAIFPALVFLASMGSSIAVLVIVNQPGTGIFSRIGTDMITTWYMCSIFLNVIATLYIVGRLMMKRKAIVRALGAEHSKQYVGIAAMLVESAALYSVFGIIFVVTFLRASALQNIVLPILGVMEGISPLLIIYRVATGRAWAGQHTLANTPQVARYTGTSGGKHSGSRTGATSYPLSDLASTNVGNNSEVVIGKESGFWDSGSGKGMKGNGVAITRTTNSYTDAV